MCDTELCASLIENDYHNALDFKSCIASRSELADQPTKTSHSVHSGLLTIHGSNLCYEDPGDIYPPTDRYKSRLAVKGYNLTYEINNDETFTHVAKMGTIRTLIYFTLNSG